MEGWANVAAWLGMLRSARPVFHSEADLQHALAWAIHLCDPSARIRLETRPEPGMRLDLLVSQPDLNEHLAVELKYLTASWTGGVDGEQFKLLSQAAQDIRAYDVVKDIQRVERLVDRQPGWSGLVLVLTNDPAYWARPAHIRATNAQAFRIYEDQLLSGTRTWGPATGVGTRKDREADLELRGHYKCKWTDYSALPGPLGRFRLLAFTIGEVNRVQLLPTADSEYAPPRLSPPEVTEYQPEPQARPAQRSGQPEGRRATRAVPLRDETPDDHHYTVDELRAELHRFELNLRAAGLKENSVNTYVERTKRFLRWLDGDYQPKGPN